jgi:hypothetical protein
MTTPALPPKPGVQLASTVCTTRVVLVKALAGQQPVIECGGSPMVVTAPGAKPALPGPNAATLKACQRSRTFPESPEIT